MVTSLKFFTVTMPNGKQYRTVGKSRQEVADSLGVDVDKVKSGATSFLPNICEFLQLRWEDGR